MSEKKIFVSIASYKDPELQSTVLSLLHNAQNPYNINIGIAWQGNFNTFEESLDLCFLKNFLIDKRNFEESKKLSSQDNFLSLIYNKTNETHFQTDINFEQRLNQLPIWVRREYFNDGIINDLYFINCKNYLSREYSIPVIGIRMNKIEQECDNFIRIAFIPYSLSLGPVVARAIAQLLFRNEYYYMQIDSHMRFSLQWDVLLIEDLKICEKLTKFKPILTNYPPSYEFGTKYSQAMELKPPTLLGASSFDLDGLVRVKAKYLNEYPKFPIKGFFWAAGFSFSKSEVIKFVPYDPDLKFVFFGEEQSMWIRLFTHGFDFFSPKKTCVYHLWKKPYNSFRDTYKVDRCQAYADFSQGSNKVRIIEQEIENKAKAEMRARSLEKIKKVLYHEGISNTCKKKLGIGMERSVSAFWQNCDIDVTNKKLSLNAINGTNESVKFIDNKIYMDSFLIFSQWNK